MKKILLKPGYEFIFTLSLMAILGLPPLLFAQDTKDIQITIINGDTTINGKNIKQLSAKDRKEALKDISNIDNSRKLNGFQANAHHGDMVAGRAYKMDSGDMDKDSLTVKNWSIHKEPGVSNHMMKFKFKDGGAKDSVYMFNYHTYNEPGDKHKLATNEWRDEHRGDDHTMEFNHKNTQIFNYVNIDAQGISTHISYRVSEPSGSVHHMDGSEESAQLEVLTLKDLTLVPQFEAGKTVLSFSLSSKATAEVLFKDNQNNLIWSGKAINGVFSKTFNLGLNGVYYLHVKQGHNLAVKKIFKE